MRRERSNDEARQHAIDAHDADPVGGVGEIPDHDVWKRCYVLEGTSGPVRRVYITTEIHEEIQECQKSLQSAVSGEWSGVFSRQLPVMNPYSPYTIWMPVAVRVYPNHIEIGTLAGDGWTAAIDLERDDDLYQNSKKAWFETILPNKLQSTRKLQTTAIHEVLHPDDQSEWEGFQQQLIEQDQLSELIR